MAISINTNMAATRASQYLASNHANLQRSLDRLSSGKRITQPADDAGGLAVAMKLEHSINGLRGASSNISNAISFLQVQDGILDSAAQIVSRMGELQSMSSDVTKNTADIDNYEAEFNDLREQLWSMTKTEFNGIALFGDWDSDDTTSPTGFNLDSDGDGSIDNTERDDDDASLQVITSENGTTNVRIHRALLGSALMVSNNGSNALGTKFDVLGTAGGAITGLVKDPSQTDAKTLSSTDNSHFGATAFTQALENIAALRATNGGQVKRLMYAQADVETKISNMTAAHGRIMDVDVASESSNLARQQILVQASAAMTAQANASNDVALMLLR